jgi:hypothetical protein
LVKTVGISTFPQNFTSDLKLAIRQALFLLALVFSFTFTLYSQQPFSIKADDKQITIEGIYESEVFSVGKNVIIKEQAKGVLCFGCDVVIEGRVIGDVATIGGTVIQKDGAFIGGDVIILGGTYQHEREFPLRNAETQTVIFAGHEEEFKQWAQNPLDIFAPKFTVSFISMRLLAVLFWFVVSLAVATIAPGAVSRSAARFQLSLLKVVGVGFLGFLGGTVLVAVSAGFFPDYVGIVVGGMIVVLLFLSYVYGRVTLQAVAGKWLLRRISTPGGKQSEAVALLIGSFICTLLISLPYIWTFSIFVMLIISIGLVLTGIFSGVWKKAEKV